MGKKSQEYILNYEKQELWIVNFFWLGYMIYIVAFTISTTEKVSYVLCNIFQIIGLITIVTTSAFLVQLRIENNYLRIIFRIYFLWLIGILLRGFALNYDFLKLMLFNPFESIFIYLTPLIILFRNQLLLLKRVFWAIVILGIVFILFDIIFIKDLINPYYNLSSQSRVEYFSKTLSIPCGFILLTYIYHSNKRNYFAILIISLTLFFALIRARRGLALLAFSSIIYSYLIYYSYSKNKLYKVAFFFLILIFVTLAAVYFKNIVSYLGDNRITGWFVDRVGESTRSGVEEYFYNDMKPLDWTIGKGINGQYFCPGVIVGEGTISVYRRGIETDFLNIILKGGIISLGLKLLIAIPAMFLGFLKSKNLLSKASAIWIMIYLVFLYPSTVTSFTLSYILLWISIGICYTKQVREMSDDEIKGKIFDVEAVKLNNETKDHF